MIVPFIVEQEQANKEFKDWSSSRWFAPNASQEGRQDGQHERLVLARTGDSTTRPRPTTGASAARHYWEDRDLHGHRRERSRQGKTRTRQVQHTRWYPASGQVSSETFVDVVTARRSTTPGRAPAREAGTVVDREEATGLPVRVHRRLRDAALHRPRRTRGFTDAQQQMAEQIERDCRDDIGGDEQRVGKMRTTDADVMFRLLLFPLWIATYIFAGKTYHVYVNTPTPVRSWASDLTAL